MSARTPIVAADIRTLKRRARQTELGIHLALAWLALDVWRKLPGLARLTLTGTVIYLGYWSYRHWAIPLLLAFLYASWRLARGAWEGRTWHRVAPPRRDYYEIERLDKPARHSDDIPF